MYLLICALNEESKKQSDQSSSSRWRNFASLAVQNALSENSDQDVQSDLNFRWVCMFKVTFSAAYFA